MTTPTEEKVLENRLRRVAARRGLRLEKSRRRDRQAIDYGGYMLVDAYTNTVVAGADPFAYSCTLNQIGALLDGGIQAKGYKEEAS